MPLTSRKGGPQQGGAAIGPERTMGPDNVMGHVSHCVLALSWSQGLAMPLREGGPLQGPANGVYCYCYCCMVQDLPEHPVGSQ